VPIPERVADILSERLSSGSCPAAQKVGRSTVLDARFLKQKLLFLLPQSGGEKLLHCGKLTLA
jgi:hypothetical protein